MNYLVTGVAGFIASRVTELLIAAGHSVVGLDNLNDYYDVRLKNYRLDRLLGYTATKTEMAVRSRYATDRTDLTDKSGRFTFRYLDIERLQPLQALFQEFKFDGVFNLAARAGVRYSVENPYVYLSTNALGTLNLLECMRACGVSKHVLASSSSLYAGCPTPFREDLPVNAPLSPYAATKKAAELLAYSYYKLHGIDTTVVRYFTVFGPAGRPDMSIFRFIKWIDEHKPLKVFGDGTQTRDFTYVDDIARGTIMAAKPLGYEIINLGGGREPITLNALIALIESALGLTADVLRMPFHSADVMETGADISRAKAILNWEPTVTCEEGIRRTVAWHRENREWVREIDV